MKICYFFLNSVVTLNPVCCFHEWANWEENSLTCGEICRGPKRRICQGAKCVPVVYDCTTKYTKCPWFELGKLSCDVITCRELIF